MKRKIYVASSWRNQYQPDIVYNLRCDGHQVYDFRNPNKEYVNSNPNARGFQWSEIDGNWETWDQAHYLRALRHPLSEQGFRSDFEAMEWADTCVLVLPSGQSAHLEAGWFVGQGKEVFIYMPERVQPDLMYKMVNGIYTDTEELLRKLNFR